MVKKKKKFEQHVSKNLVSKRYNDFTPLCQCLALPCPLRSNEQCICPWHMTPAHLGLLLGVTVIIAAKKKRAVRTTAQHKPARTHTHLML